MQGTITGNFIRSRPPKAERIQDALKNPYAITRAINDRSFYRFLQHFWPAVSAHTFSPNWHIEYLCGELEKVAERVANKQPRLHDLIINVPPGSTKPLWEEQDILMGDGTYKKLKDIQKGDFIINRFAKSTEVTGVHIQGNLPCVKIHTFGGRDIFAAYDHPILTADGWKNAIDIREGQMLALLHRTDIKGTTERNIDEFRLAGYLIGDGSVANNSCSVCGTDMEYIEDLIGCINRLGFGYYRHIDKNGVTVVNLKNKDHIKVKPGTYKGKGRGYKEMKGPRQWVRDIGIAGTNSKTKKIPDFVWKGSDDQVKAFLASYFQCDGCVSYRDSKKRNVTVSATTISKELAVGLQRLFLRIGVPMKLRKRVQKNGYAYNPDLKDYVYYTIDTTEQDSAVRFLEEIPFIGYKLEKLKEFAPRKRTFTQEYWPDEVMSVEKVGALPCRCLSVESGKSFTVDGVVVHNTVTVSIMFPAWCWTKWPWMRFICASYSSALSLESAEYCRDLIKSPQFQEIYPEVGIKEDKDTRSNFKIIKRAPVATGSGLLRSMVGGGRYSTSVGGTLMGFHADILIVDDPLNPSQAASDIELANANRWMEQTLPTRKTNKDNTPTILIMQRLHQSDPTGYILSKQKENIKHICLPGEIRNYRKQLNPPELAVNYVDDLLDTKRISWNVLKDLEADLGQYGYAGQIGQDPTPPGGGMFKIDRLNYMERLDNPNHIVKTVRYWDKAGTQDGGAYTVGVKMSLLMNGKWLVEDVRRGRWSTDRREQIIKDTAVADGLFTQVWVEQEPGSSGKESSENTIRNLAGFSIYAEKPTGDKIFRADPFSVQVNNGNVILLKGMWNKDYVDELRYFPYSTFKDQTDASSGAFSKLVPRRIARRIT